MNIHIAKTSANCESKTLKSFLTFTALAAIVPAVALSADKVVGFREKMGVHVGSGTVTETDNVIIGDGGEKRKPLAKWAFRGALKFPQTASPAK